MVKLTQMEKDALEQVVKVVKCVRDVNNEGIEGIDDDVIEDFLDALNPEAELEETLMNIDKVSEHFLGIVSKN